MRRRKRSAPPTMHRPFTETPILRPSLPSSISLWPGRTANSGYRSIGRATLPDCRGCSNCMAAASCWAALRRMTRFAACWRGKRMRRWFRSIAGSVRSTGSRLRSRSASSPATGWRNTAPRSGWTPRGWRWEATHQEPIWRLSAYGDRRYGLGLDIMRRFCADYLRGEEDGCGPAVLFPEHGFQRPAAVAADGGSA